MTAKGWCGRHLRVVRQTYRRRRKALIGAIGDRLPGWDIGGAAAGLHLPVALPTGTDVTRVVREATALGVPVVDLGRYRLRPAGDVPPGLVLGFGNLRSGHEEQAVAVLASALRRARA